MEVDHHFSNASANKPVAAEYEADFDDERLQKSKRLFDEGLSSASRLSQLEKVRKADDSLVSGIEMMAPT